jgi:peptidoglycan/xylan/chitin deacetylase (PgdA/CDA1 family)
MLARRVAAVGLAFAVAVGLGTWVGVGRPPVRAVFESGVRALHAFGKARSGGTASSVPTPVPLPQERHADAVDGSPVVSDAAPPIPRLNPDARTERAWLIAQGPAHSPGDGRRLVTFTFDDGPSPETTPSLLRILAAHHVRATFFFIGRYLTGEDGRAREARQWAARIAAEGHLVGNHTLDHQVLTRLSHAAAAAQIDASASAIERATGQRPWLFRPPYGAMNDWLEAAARDRHLELLLWSIDPQDIKRGNPEEIERQIIDQLEYAQGGIVLLHDVHWASVRALPRILRWLEASPWDSSHPARRGWDIVDLGEYLRATAASPQPFRTRDELERARREPNPADRRRAEL